MAAGGPQLKSFVVHWADLASRTPIRGDAQSQATRRDLFDSYDTKGNGILFKGVVLRGLYRLLPTISGIPDTRPMLNRAFKTTVSVTPPVAPIGDDNVDRNQFRVLLIYIWHYLKIWELLCQHPQQVKGHVSYSDFEATLCWLKDWGFPEAQVLQSDPTAGFDRLFGGNPVPNEEFCDRIVKGALKHLASLEEADERQMAKRMLMRLQPHLFEGRKSQDASYVGIAAPPVPPPGQRRPPPAINDPTMNPDFKPNNFRRWTTQYNADFEAPSRIYSQAASAAPSHAPSRTSYSQARTRAATPPNGWNSTAALPTSAFPRDTQQPSILRKSESLPEARQTLTGLDRDALRAKLENHIAMSTTGGMRKLLRVAGSMVMGDNARGGSMVMGDNARGGSMVTGDNARGGSMVMGNNARGGFAQSNASVPNGRSTRFAPPTG